MKNLIKNISLVNELLEEEISTLIYGNQTKTGLVLQNCYNSLKNKKQNCFYFDWKNTKYVEDFFVSILKTNLGEADFDKKISIIEKSANKCFKNLAVIDKLAYLADIYEGTAKSNLKDFIFINGIENLLYKLDSIDNNQNFGNTLRARFHQSGNAVFCGSILNADSQAYNTTIGNGVYPFYFGNFGIRKIN